MVGETVARAAEAKAASHNTKALIMPLVEGKGEPEPLTRKKGSIRKIWPPHADLW
jgi:hypothetical protein